MLSFVSHQFPFLSQMPLIVFFFFLWDALEWKNFVLWSPWPYHNTLELWCHKISSQSRRSLISFLNLVISFPILLLLSWRTNALSAFLLFWICFGIWPKVDLFHLAKSTAQTWRLVAMPSGVHWCKLPSHAFFMISLHSSFFVHISSKWNLRFCGGRTTMVLAIKRAQWSEVESTKWITLVPLNKLI